jgi:hypothetical protein
VDVDAAVRRQQDAKRQKLALKNAEKLKRNEERRQRLQNERQWNMIVKSSQRRASKGDSVHRERQNDNQRVRWSLWQDQKRARLE